MKMKFVLSCLVLLLTIWHSKVHATANNRTMGNYPDTVDGQQRTQLEEYFKLLQQGHATVLLSGEGCPKAETSRLQHEKRGIDRFCAVTLANIDRAIAEGVITVDTFDKLAFFVPVRQYLSSGRPLPDCVTREDDHIFLPFMENYAATLNYLMIRAVGHDPIASKHFEKLAKQADPTAADYLMKRADGNYPTSATTDRHDEM